METTATQKPEFSRHELPWRAALTVGLVGAGVTFVLTVLLIANFYQLSAVDPLNAPELQQLHDELRAAPKADPALVERIRAMDLLARKSFFTSEAQQRLGGWLLLGAAVVTFVALKLAGHWRPELPGPEGERDAKAYWQSRSLTRHLIGAATVVLIALSLVAVFVPQSLLAEARSAEETAQAKADAAAATAEPEEAGVAAFPPWDEMQQQWPNFRGPGGLGVAYYTNAPTSWDVESGTNIKWKAKVPMSGFNSPVVWGKRLFLTGASEEKREVYCFDTETGELLWQKAVGPFPNSAATPPSTTPDTGLAAPTAATDGQRVYAIFGTGDLVAFDFEGNQVWGRNVQVPVNHYGHSSSLIVHEDLLIVQMDDNEAPKLFAVKGATGEQAWLAERDSISWASPAIARTKAGVQLLVNSEDDVTAYDPKSGKKLWSEECLGGEVGPSPAFDKNIVMVANEYASATGIKVKESGATPAIEVLWEWNQSLPEVSSPVGAAGHFYIATSYNEVVCLGAASGESAWAHDFDNGFYSSAVAVGDKIYLLDLEGKMNIFKTGPTFELVAEPDIKEPSYATPAYMDGRIYLRTALNLYCIEKTE